MENPIKEVKYIGPFEIANLVMGSLETSDSLAPRETNVPGEQVDFETLLAKHFGRTHDGKQSKKTQVQLAPEGDNEKPEDMQGLIQLGLVVVPLVGQNPPEISQAEPKIQAQGQIPVESMLEQALPAFEWDLPQPVLEQLNQLAYKGSEANQEQIQETTELLPAAENEAVETPAPPKHPLRASAQVSPRLGKEDGVHAQLQEPKEYLLETGEARVGERLDLESQPFAENTEVGPSLTPETGATAESSLELKAKGTVQQTLPEEASFSMAEDTLTLSQPEDTEHKDLLTRPIELSQNILDNFLQAVANVLSTEVGQFEAGLKIASKELQVTKDAPLEEALTLQENPDVADDKIAGESRPKVDDTTQQEKESTPVKMPQTRERISTDKHTEIVAAEMPRQEPVVEVSNQEAPIREVLDLGDRENLFPKLVQNIKSLVTEERSEVRIQLKPDHLGELKIKLSLERGIMVAEFIVQNEAVREVIASQLPQLHTALQDQGTQMSDVQINIGLGHKEQEQQDQPRSRQFHQDSQGRMAKSAAPSGSKSYLGGGIWNQVDVRV